MEVELIVVKKADELWIAEEFPIELEADSPQKPTLNLLGGRRMEVEH